jgi:HKD family nuclease
MGKSQFILQGFTPRTHLEAVRRLFEVAGMAKAILSVAFANEAGVELVAEQIERAGNKTTAFVGINNAITSRQALTRLFQLGVRLFVVDTGSPNILFHPKLYFARGAEQARLIVGSANLTAGGLNNNVEAGMAVELDLAIDADRAVAEQVEAEFDRSLTTFATNITAMENLEAIQHLQDTNRLLDEAVIRAQRAAAASQRLSDAQSPTDWVSPIKLLVKPIWPTSRQSAVGDANSTTPDRTPPDTATPSPVAPVIPALPDWDLVWRSNALTERDLNIPTGGNTAVTGSMLFKQGQWSHVDQRHYFRDDVFGDLIWTADSRPRRTHLERARANFTMVIEGVNHGDYTLRLTHNGDATSRAYEQSNSMTQVHWEGVTGLIRRRSLLRKRMSLYRDKNDRTRFMIEIN